MVDPTTHPFEFFIINKLRRIMDNYIDSDIYQICHEPVINRGKDLSFEIFKRIVEKEREIPNYLLLPYPRKNFQKSLQHGFLILSLW